MASQRSERARRFLELFRHSQMYEVFITERLKLAAEGYEGPGALQDAFEQKVTALQNRMTGKKLGKTLVTASAKSVSNLTSIIRNAGQSVRVSSTSSSLPYNHCRAACTGVKQSKLELNRQSAGLLPIRAQRLLGYQHHRWYMVS